MYECIKDLKYVGEKRAKLYHKLNIYTVKDLVYHCPRSYVDLSKIFYIVDAPVDEYVAIKVTIVSKQPPFITYKRGLVVYKIFAKDATAGIILTFFNEPYTFNNINIGDEYILYGKINKNNFDSKYQFEISSPLIEKANKGNKLIPVYPLTAGLTSKIIKKNILDALKIPGLTDEYLADWILKKADIINLKLALNYIHSPNSMADVLKARKRIVFDELLLFSLSLISIKKKNLQKTPFVIQDVDMNDFYKKLQFELTKAQYKVIDEIINDMKKSVPMNRLLQGDVGSGKTIVAVAAIYLVCKNNAQVAFMAPTEILAIQHFNSVSKIISSFGLKVGLLIGSVAAKQKNKIKTEIEQGKIDVIVGTHAILQDTVIFKNLGLVITDEQHRFGVKQRSKLSEKGKNPHQLVMSATPIPRTLSLIIYGDLDISIIDQLPLNRKPILTYFVNSSKRLRVYSFLKKFIDKGRQAYIVCPAIEQNEKLNLKSVIEYGERLKEKDFKDYRVAIIHGKTKPDEKDNIMANFKNGNIDLLVSTTVIEVGIDVPNAVVMVIEDADRFGLSQLHQLRGRVGRGIEQSYCILISDTKAVEAVNKLKMISKTYDGFKISEYDLELRGPGDFFGERQHGLPNFKYFDMIKDIKLLKLSQDVAIDILKNDLYLEKAENKHLKELVKNMTKNISF